MANLPHVTERKTSLPRPETPTVYDLLVIGGGVNGCGIARDAVGRGLSVVLCEKGDLAEGTSSASTKLFHGGLRYLEQLNFSLVFEALLHGSARSVQLERLHGVLAAPGNEAGQTFAWLKKDLQLCDDAAPGSLPLPGLWRQLWKASE